MITVMAHHAAAAGAVRHLVARHAGCLTRRTGLPAVRRPPRLENPDKFALVERYEQQAAFAEHRRTPHFRRNVETELVALLTARS